MGFPFEFAEKREQAICPLTSSCSSCPLWFNIFHSVNGYETFYTPTGFRLDRGRLRWGPSWPTALTRWNSLCFATVHRNDNAGSVCVGLDVVSVAIAVRPTPGWAGFSCATVAG